MILSWWPVWPVAMGRWQVREGLQWREKVVDVVLGMTCTPKGRFSGPKVGR